MAQCNLAGPGSAVRPGVGQGICIHEEKKVRKSAKNRLQLKGSFQCTSIIRTIMTQNNDFSFIYRVVSKLNDRNAGAEHDGFP